MTFRSNHSRPGERGERLDQPDAVNPYMTTNPTIVLPAVGTGDDNNGDDGDSWATNAAMPQVTPDVLEMIAGQTLQTATEDLWALSSAVSADRGVWAESGASGQSDFLVVEPSLNTFAPESSYPGMATPAAAPRSQSTPPAAHITPIAQVPPLAPVASNATTASSVNNGWPLRNAIAYNDPLRPLSVAISVAIERHFRDQNELPPAERTPEHTETIRRFAANYLRHDRAAADLVSDATEAERLLAMVVDEMLGFGPLDPLLRDETVSEIMVTGPYMTYVEQGGRLLEVPIHFEDDAHLMRVIQKILQPLGLSVSPTSPIADGRLPDGTRINVVVPPSAASGPTLTIRRPVRRVFSLEQLVRGDALSLHMADFLRLCVNARLNVVISGSSGSGKTTFLNALASSINEHERIVTIEETAELQLYQRHIVPLHARPTGEGAAAVTAGELLVNALRMRPQRIILGDCRGHEAFPMVQAMNVGFDGSMTTLYANSARDALVRLEALCLASGAVGMLAARRQIATGVDLIVHCARLRDGTRRITHVTDVLGMDGEVVATQDLFVFREAGLDMSTGRIRGEFAATGARPSFANRIEDSQSQTFFPHSFPRGA